MATRETVRSSKLPITTAFALRRHRGERRLFLSLNVGDLSVDWLDITDHAANFIMINKDGVATRLAQKLGLSQSPGKDVMQKFAARTRELLPGRTVDQAAMAAAQEIFRPNSSRTFTRGVTTQWTRCFWKSISCNSRRRERSMMECAMQALQWIIAAVTAVLVTSVGYLQWRTGSAKGGARPIRSPPRDL